MSKKKIIIVAASLLAVFAMAFFGAYFYLNKSQVNLRSLPPLTSLTGSNPVTEIRQALLTGSNPVNAVGGIIKEKLPRAYIVQSGSMEPSIQTGSLVISYPSPNYWIGDVITFERKQGSKDLVTHRVMNRTFPEGVGAPPLYATSGDANEDFDPGAVKHEQVVGRVITNIPHLGYVANFAKTPYGFILLVIVPATIVIYEELKTALRELGKGPSGIIGGLRKKKKKEGSEPEISVKWGGMKSALSKSSVLLPVFGAFLVFTGLASSFFRDSEGSSSNLFQAGEWNGEDPSITPTPSPPPDGNLVINEVMPLSDCRLGNDVAQWIEIYNGYSVEVNLKDYQITDGTSSVALVNAGNIILQPGEFALLSHDNSTWTQCYDDNGVLTANFGTGDLDLNTGVLELLDSSDVIIDHVQWDDSNSFDDVNPGLNQSIEREPVGTDSATGSNWNPADFVLRDPPTPGQ